MDILRRLFKRASTIYKSLTGKCAKADWNEDAEQSISVVIWHEEGYADAAEIVQGYAEYAIAELAGDDYRIDVSVSYKPVPSDVIFKNGDHMQNFRDWRWADKDRREIDGVDCNHLVYTGPHFNGGGGFSTAGMAEVLEQSTLDGICVEAEGSSEAHEAVNYHLHEIGHALAFDHILQDTDPIDPMATSYVSGSSWIHEYHKSSTEELEIIDK